MSLLSLILPSFVLLAAVTPTYGHTANREDINAPRNALGLLGAYSPNSSNILLGTAKERKLLNFGIAYERRLFVNRSMNWQYSAEFLPIAIESDPIQTMQLTITTISPPSTFDETLAEPTPGVCKPFSGKLDVPDYGTETYVVTCGRRWTMGEALSPAGLRLSLLPAHRLQPFIVGHGGYMYSSTEIPISGAGSFNFTFDGGAGVELYTSKARSMRVEYRYHHISNHGTATFNPGIDNGLIQFTYSFGWGR